jgi:hypothetical protein
MATAASLQTIQQFYVAYYGRPADPAGLEYWATRLDTENGVLTAVLDAFGTSAEATTRYGTGTNDSKVTNLYQQILGRAPDTEGLRFYSDNLTNGTFTLATVAKRIVDGIKPGTTDATTLANKTTMANSFTDTLKTDAAANAGYSGDDAAARARTWLDAVLDTAATVTTAQTDLAATITDIKPVSLTLTTGQDKFTATTTVAADKTSAVNDTITGVVSALTASNTLNNTDSIVGGSGTDTLKVSLQTSFSGFVSGVGALSGVEVLDLANVTPANGTDSARTFDTTTAVSGIKSVIVDMNDQNFTIGALAASGVTFDVRNADDNNTLTASYATAVTGASATSDKMTLILNDVGTVSTTAEKVLTVTAGGIEDLSVTANGTAGNVASLALGDVKTITVSGGAALKVTAVDNELTSFDASAATGAQTLALGGSSIVETVKTGSAADTVTLAAANEIKTATLGAGNDKITIGAMNVVATLDGGAGTGDTLVLNNLVSGTYQPTVTGFETLQISSGRAGTISAANVTDLTTVKVSDDLAADFTIAGLKNASLAVNFDQTGTTAYGALTNKLILTGSAALTATYTTDQEAAVSINTGITAANATSLAVTLNEYVSSSAAFEVNKATSVNLTVNKGATYSGNIDSDNATSGKLVVNGTSSGTTTLDKATTVNLEMGKDSAFSTVVVAPEATTVTVASTDTNLPDLDIRAAKATNLTISNASAVAFAANADFSAVKNVTLSGTKGVTTPAADKFGDDSASLTIDASALNGNLVATVGNYVAGKGSLTVTGTKLGTNTVTVAGGRNAVTVSGGIGDDTVTFNYALTGEGSYSFDLDAVSTGDKVVFKSGTDLSSSSVSFAGVDTIQISDTDNGGDSAGAGTLLASSVTGLAVKFDATDDVTLVGTTGANTINLTDVTVTAGTTLTVNGLAGADTITGGASAESINGGDGADVISAGAGNDTLNGGTGADTLTGGTGDDVFYFDKDSSSAITTSAGSALSTIADFSVLNVANADVISGGFTTGDTLTFDTIILNYGAANTWGSTARALDNSVTVVKGVYDSATKVFTFDSGASAATAGYATLVVYDTNMAAVSGAAGTTGTSFKAIVIVGVVDPTADTTGAITGLNGVGG